MNKFEAVLIFSPDLSNTMMSKEEDKFSSKIESEKGKIISTEDWGIRDISFIINNYKKAFYKFYQIEIDSVKIENIKKTLSQNEKILRYLFITVNKHAELPTKMMNNEKK